MTSHLDRRALLAALPVAATALTACATASPVSSQPTIGRIRRDSPALDALIAPDAPIEKLAAGYQWSEGPVWIPEDGGYLLFSDVPGNRIHRWSERDGVRVWMEPSGLAGPIPEGFREPGSNGLIRGPGSSILMADCGNRAVARVDLRTQAKSLLIDRVQGKRFNSPNDLVQGADGSLWFTDPPYGLTDDDRSPLKEIPYNGVYRLAPGGAVHLVHDGLSRPNGIGLSRDGRTLYVANSDPARAIIMAFDIGPDLAVSNPRVLIDLTDQVGDARPGLPDGMKVSDGGHLFATGPGGVLVLTPAGELLGCIEPGGPVANCGFGEDGRTLYMTAGDKLCRVRLRARGPV